jgi:hypothetical protein
VDDWVEGNGHKPTLPPPGTGRRRSMIVLAGLLVALPAAYLLSLGRGEWRPVVAADELEAEGVVYRPGLRMFVVHDEPVPAALSAVAPGDAGRVVYCPFADAFQSPEGAVFDQFGQALAGPVDRGLDRFPVRIRVGVVEVDVATRVEGAPPPDAVEDVSANMCEVPGEEDPAGFATERATPAP